MIRVRTGSRLHFGLFSVPTEGAGPWLNQEGQPTIPRRQFGGVGLMIEKPGIELTVEFADQFAADGRLAERALHFARTYRDCVSIKESFRVQVHSAAPEHMGLGTGTQLGLAVARGIAELTNQPARDAVTLAGHIGRGKRSAIGVHGFDQGGFLVEGGKAKMHTVSPLLGRYFFPWPVYLIFPRSTQGVHGFREREAFATLECQATDERITEAMARIVLLGMVPALIEADLDTFGEALYDYNHRAGEMYHSVQGGGYAHPWVEETVKMLRNIPGVKGVGQSSWGPCVFAVVSPGTAMGGLFNWLTRKKNVKPDQIILTRSCDDGAVLSTEYSPPAESEF